MEREWRMNEKYSNICMEKGVGDEDDAVWVVDRVLCNRYYYNGGSEELLPLSFNSAISPSSIEHPVSKLDTLAGVAIRYGVEVGDIKKMNGLVTDLQMFALKSLQIPLPGRHPPSPALLSSPGQGHYNNSISRLMHEHEDLKWKSSLHGLKLSPPTCHLLTRPTTDSPLSIHRKSTSMANCLLALPYAEAGEAKSATSSHKLVRRRQKCEDDFSPLREENRGVFGGRGLAQRPKASSEGSTATSSTGHSSYLVDDEFNRVKKSSSTSNLQGPGDATSLWSASKLNLKSDLQALSTAVTARPIFDGLPKPTSGRRNKAALD